MLAVDNAIVNKTNFNMVHEIPEDLKTFKSLDTVDNDDQQLDFPVEFLYLYVLNPARHYAKHKLHRHTFTCYKGTTGFNGFRLNKPSGFVDKTLPVMLKVDEP